MKNMLTLSLVLLSSVAEAKDCSDYTRYDEIHLLALNIYHEARNQGHDGMQMVGEVTLNRVESTEFPDTICEVVYQPGAFSWIGMSDSTPYEIDAWNESLQISRNLINSENISLFANGATYYFNRDAVSHVPSWAAKFEFVGEIGDHTFYANPMYDFGGDT